MGKAIKRNESSLFARMHVLNALVM